MLLLANQAPENASNQRFNSGHTARFWLPVQSKWHRQPSHIPLLAPSCGQQHALMMPNGTLTHPPKPVHRLNPAAPFCLCTKELNIKRARCYAPGCVAGGGPKLRVAPYGVSGPICPGDFKFAVHRDLLSGKHVKINFLQAYSCLYHQCH